jgi:hypothetical protein
MACAEGRDQQGHSSSGGGIDIGSLGGLLSRETNDARTKSPDFGDILDSFARR